jgi:amidase
MLVGFVCCRHTIGAGESRAKRVILGLSVWVNFLDYSTSILPVTLVDKNVDVVDEGYTPMNSQDEKIHLGCEPPPMPKTLLS